MKGWATLGEHDYERGAERGRRDGTAIMFRLTIATTDVYRFIEDRDHLAETHGYVHCDVLGGRLSVNGGTFNLFVDDGPAHKRMLYRLYFDDSVGRPLTLAGFKDIPHEPLTKVWPETSTLYTRVFDGHVESDADDDTEPVLTGILKIAPLDFAWQMTTFRVHGPAGGRLGALGAFGALFASELWQVFKPMMRSGHD